MKHPALMLVAGMGLALSGCISAQSIAEGKARRLNAGMTREDVAAAIGRPVKTSVLQPIPHESDQTVEVWVYEFNSEMVGEDVVIGVLLVAAVALAVASKSCGNVGGGGGSRSWSRRFFLGFGPDGRLRGISQLECAP